MEMRDDEIGVVQINIRAGGTEENSRHAADHKLGNKSQRPEHWRLQMDRSAVQRCDVKKNHFRDGNGNQQGRDRKNIGHARIDPGNKLMMRPHDETQEADGPGRVQDGLIAEYFFAGKYRNDLRHNSHGRKQYDIHLGMAEKPKQVLPQKRIAAARRIKEASGHRLIKQQHYRAGDQTVPRKP